MQIRSKPLTIVWFDSRRREGASMYEIPFRAQTYREMLVPWWLPSVHRHWAQREPRSPRRRKRLQKDRWCAFRKKGCHQLKSNHRIVSLRIKSSQLTAALKTYKWRLRVKESEAESTRERVENFQRTRSNRADFWQKVKLRKIDSRSSKQTAFSAEV